MFKKKVKIQNKRCFDNIFESKYIIKEELQKIQDRMQREEYTLYLVREENEKMVECHDIITKEEIYWRQRSRSVWLNEGDKNTIFSHFSTLKHREKTRISNLKKGILKITEEKEILEEMVSFFFYSDNF